jgi:hypothetical protein
MDAQTANTKTVLMVLQFILPVVLAIIAGYGSVRYASGENQAKQADLERRVKADEEMLQKLSDRMATKDDVKNLSDILRGDLQDIKTDIRALRNQR